LTRPRALVIAEGDAISAVLALTEQLHQPLVLIGSNHTFPFRPRPSRIVVSGMPDGIIACMPVLDERGIASRLASPSDLPGCFEGLVTDLARIWLGSLNTLGLGEIEIHPRGPPALLDSVLKLALDFAMPCRTAP
jgi:dihydroorotate dehydrogenase electron transfer subunit